jgi:8-oxo-dGTP pyrophosphatase MutT (NUDIX family)
MRLIREIYCRPNLPPDGRIFHREAVRGIIRHADKFLLIHSPVDGDYKFPGGGVKPGERLHTALLRELREECGVDLTEISGDYGKTIEYDLPQEEQFDLFRMVSYYYFCRINPEKPFQAQRLDGYEQKLCIHPVWMTLESALAANRVVAASPSKIPPRWVQREIVVMEELLTVQNNSE